MASPPTFNAAPFFDRELYSDVKIKAGEHLIKCHKIVLASASKYFQTLLSEEWSVESGQPLRELKDDNPDAVRDMLKYIYTSDYDATVHEDSEEDRAPALRHHLEMYTVADKYDVPTLKEKARSAIGDLVDQADTDCTDAQDAEELINFIQILLDNKDRYPDWLDHIQLSAARNHHLLMNDRDFRKALLDDEYEVLENIKKDLEKAQRNYTMISCVKCRISWFEGHQTRCTHQGSEAEDRYCFEVDFDLDAGVM